MTTPEPLSFFLHDDPRGLHNPFLMPSMAEAVERINAAVDSGEKILIFGDRDVDGITSTVLLFEALQEMGADVHWMLPEGRGGLRAFERRASSKRRGGRRRPSHHGGLRGLQHPGDRACRVAGDRDRRHRPPQSAARASAGGGGG